MLKEIYSKYLTKNKMIVVMYITLITISSVTAVAIPSILKNILDSRSTILVYTLVGVIIVCSVSNFVSRCIHTVIFNNVISNIRDAVTSKLLKLPMSYYENSSTSYMRSLYDSDCTDICRFYIVNMPKIFKSCIKFVGASIILFRTNATITIIIMALSAIVALVYYKSMKKSNKLFDKRRKYYKKMSAIMYDILSGIKVVKVLDSENYSRNKISTAQTKVAESDIKVVRYNGFVDSIIDIVINLIPLIIILPYILQGRAFGAEIIVFIMYIGNLTDPMLLAMDILETYQDVKTATSKFKELMAEEITIKEIDNPIEVNHFIGNIEFDNVKFQYNENDIVFDNLNLRIKPNEFVAIVGPSGAGKSTLCNLLTRLYDATDGKIMIDGKDIKNYSFKSLYSNIGIVQQDVFLLNDTILENIRYAKLDATDEEIIAAAKLANAHEFITDMIDGYKTVVGERGIKLSGGQKQRISLARLFLRNPSVVILDEATSALDNISEKIIQESINKLAGDKTIIAIAHRLSTIRNADRIVVLDKHGKIAEEGSHDELLSGKGEYYKMYRTAITESPVNL